MRFSGNSIPMYNFMEKDGQVINVPIERWVWTAVYTDGTPIHQFSPTREFHQVGEIDQDRLLAISLHYFNDANKCIQIRWKEGMRLIHKYRNIVLDAFGENKKYRIYIFGYKYENQYVYHYVLPDDSIITSPTDDVELSKYL